MPISREERARRSALKEYEYLWCRTMGHDWEEWHTEHEPEFGYYEAVYCPRCTTERLFTISMLGEVIARRYIYPENYKMAFKFNAADFRRQMRKAGWWSESARSEAARMVKHRPTPLKAVK